MAGRETSIHKGSVSHRRSGIHRAFSHIAHKRRNVRFNGLWRVHTPPHQQDRTQRLTGRNKGVSSGGGITTIGPFCAVQKPCVAGGQNGFAAFGSWSGVLPKSAESLRDSDTLMRVAVPRRRGPAGLRDPIVFFSHHIDELHGFAQPLRWHTEN